MATYKTSTGRDSVEPVFFQQWAVVKPRGLGQKTEFLKPYEVCVAASKAIGAKHVDGAQNVRGIWRIYTKSRESRVSLLTKGINLRQTHIALFEKNPRTTNVSDPSIKVEKILIKDLPLSLANEEIMSYLKDHENIEITSIMRYSCERDDNGDLTHFKNGDRFVYAVWPVTPALPPDATIIGRKCRIHHPSQNNLCKACKEPGHKIGSDKCKSYCADQDITTFRTYTNILSNHHPTPIEVAPDTVFDSNEHAYQYEKALKCGYEDVAELIKDAKHAGIAKALSKRIKKEDLIKWGENDKLEYMEFLVRTKIEQSGEFLNVLLDTGSVIAEATVDPYWGTGLSPDMTAVTDPAYWPGDNMMGKILMKIKKQIKDNVNIESEIHNVHPDSDIDTEMLTATSAIIGEKTEVKDIISENTVNVADMSEEAAKKTDDTTETRTLVKSAADSTFTITESPTKVKDTTKRPRTNIRKPGTTSRSQTPTRASTSTPAGAVNNSDTPTTPFQTLGIDSFFHNVRKRLSSKSPEEMSSPRKQRNERDSLQVV